MLVVFQSIASPDFVWYIDVFDLAGLVIVRLVSPFVLHFVKFLESFGRSMDSRSSLVAREEHCIF